MAPTPRHGSRVEGFCDARFVAVRDAFAENFATHGEIGACVAARIDGRVVVDLWGGLATPAGRPWERDTIVDVFSVGKAMVALSLLVLVQRGQLAFDDPVCRHWPEFAHSGKGDVTVAQLMSHQAGVPGIRRPLAQGDLYDWPTMTAALASEVPWWTPGTAVGYHVNTLGFLGGELVRRISGTPFATFFRRELAGPLNADFQFGTPATDDQRTADYQFPNSAVAGAAAQDEDAMRVIYRNPPGASGIGTANTRAWRAAVHPSTNGHANARAIAAIYDVLARDDQESSVRLDPAVLARATSVLASGHDVVLDRPSRFGFGFQLSSSDRPISPGPRSFGHFGAGGSLGMADPEAHLAFGYCMNRFGLRWRDPRNQALLGALYGSL